MKALSLRQPWAWLIVEGHKDIENRTWSTRYRGPLVIHASSKRSRREYDQVQHWCCSRGLPEPAPMGEIRYGGIIATATLVDVVDHFDSPWFFGPYGWILEDVRRIKFRPFKGMLQLFNVPDALVGD